MSFIYQFSDVQIRVKSDNGSLFIEETILSERMAEILNPDIAVCLNPIEDKASSNKILYEYRNVKVFNPKLPRTKKEITSLLNYAITMIADVKNLHQKKLSIGLLNMQRVCVDDNNKLVIIGNTLITDNYNLKLTEGGSLDDNYFYPPECYDNNSNIPDYRVDFYTFGVLLYRWFTGKFPIKGKDNLEIMHKHLTKTPNAPIRLNDALPKGLSDLILSLLEKNPNERYLSAFGILKDLNIIKDLFQKNSKSVLSLNIKYNPGRVSFGNAIFGREDELKKLKELYNLVDLSESQVVFIDGFSGVGKTSLINTFLKSIKHKRTLVLRGKFDQFSQTPYKVFESAFMDLDKQLFIEASISTDSIQKVFQDNLGKNLSVLERIIPSIESITRVAAKAEVLNPIEDRNRFNFVFHKFCETFHQLGLKVILFVDDWQWCDQPTLQLMRSLIQQKPKGFLFLLAYRDNEINDKHSFNLLLNEVAKKETSTQISLEALSLEVTNRMLADALEIEEKDAKTLSRLIHKKTKGNPFYTKQFVTSLNQKELLLFNGASNNWEWKSQQIEQENLTENVVDLITDSIDKLSYESQIIFKIASFTSGKFDLNLISEISNINEVLLKVLLDVSLGSGYISKQIINNHETYKFVHDRIQQAAYSLDIPSFDYEREELHYKVGIALLNKKNSSFSNSEVLSHFIISKHLISKDVSKSIIGLIIDSGNAQRFSTTPKATNDYFQLGLFLNEKFDVVESNFEFLFKLSETNFLLNNIKEAEYYALKAYQSSETIIQKVDVLRMKMLFYESYAMYENNINTGLKALSLFGIDIITEFQNNTLETSIQSEYNLFNSLTINKDYSKALLNSKMVDENQLAIMDVLVNMNASAYFVDLYLFAWSTIKMSNQTLLNGFTNSTPFAFVFMGTLLVSMYQDFERGYSFGKSGVDLLNRVNSDKYKCRTLSIFPIFIQHFKEPIRDSISNLDESIYSGLETGDLPYSGYSFYAKVRDSFLSGSNLEGTLKLCDESIAFMENVNNLGLLSLMKLLKGSILKLVGMYSGEYKKVEEEALQFLLDVKFYTAVSHHYIFRSWVLCILKEFKDAIRLLGKNEEIIIYAASQPHVPKHYFLSSLCILNLNKMLSKKQKAQIIENQKILKGWSDSMPENFSAEYALINTLLQAKSGDIEKAIVNFNETLKWAEKGELIGTKSLAFELMSAVLKESNFEDLGKSFYESSQLEYKNWGAYAKLQYIEESGSKLKADSLLKNSDLSTASLIKSMQVISSEVDKVEVIKKLLNVLMENAGADRSLLILIENEVPYVEAELRLNEVEYILNKKHLSRQKDLPKRIVNYVINTKREFVLEDFKANNQLNEPYIKRAKVKSLLVLPLIRQQELIGVLYLENKQLEGLFNDGVLETLRVIASQAAISIYNTLLFKETTDLNIDLEASKDELSKMNLLLEDKIKDRTKVLRQEIETRKQIEVELKKAQEAAEKYHQQQIKEEQRDALQSKMMMLSSQMNPHFIFNSLGSVQSFIFNNETTKAVDFISEFAGLMRKNLINSTTEFISISEEIEFLDKYLLLEKIRFNNSFDYEILENIENIHDTLIPPMLLQPFIENAIIHGLSKLENRKGKLKLELKETDEIIMCSITDNGIGRENAAKYKNKGHKSVAISNLETRIELLNRDSEEEEYKYEIIDLYDKKTPVGTKVMVSFPNDLH